MLPYRSASPENESQAEPPPREEVVAYGVLAAVGSIPVTGALVDHVAFHAEATIGLVMVVAGCAGLVMSARVGWAARRARAR